MAQSGKLVVLGDAGEALGDSIYEARLFVRGTVQEPGRRLRREGDARANIATAPRGSADASRHDRRSGRRISPLRLGAQLYHFHVDNAGAY